VDFEAGDQIGYNTVWWPRTDKYATSLPRFLVCLGFLMHSVVILELNHNFYEMQVAISL